MLTEGYAGMHSMDIHREGHLLQAKGQGGDAESWKPGKRHPEFTPTVQAEV